MKLKFKHTKTYNRNIYWSNWVIFWKMSQIDDGDLIWGLHHSEVGPFFVFELVFFFCSDQENMYVVSWK